MAKFQQKGKKELQESNSLEKEMRKILASNKRPYEKKLALFNLIKNLKLENPQEEERVNYLLESCLLSELAKQSLREYKKTTAENFSRIK